jgi:hypothetical protein
MRVPCRVLSAMEIAAARHRLRDRSSDTKPKSGRFAVMSLRGQTGKKKLDKSICFPLCSRTRILLDAVGLHASLRCGCLRLTSIHCRTLFRQYSDDDDGLIVQLGGTTPSAFPLSYGGCSRLQSNPSYALPVCVQTAGACHRAALRATGCRANAPGDRWRRLANEKAARNMSSGPPGSKLIV